ncbi:cobalamin ABC transporter ATP-binding protein [Gammaproteobacteria bacterium 45_16_T64]|nr:cobalamin ABC transporter ATP-binding protein [Gammaproteobacteria bacterium 45_16_T64]
MSTGLEVKQLQFSYDDHVVFSGVDLSFSKGGMVGLIGPNGAGKSTLLNALIGLVKPELGEIRLNNRCINRIKRRELAKHITLVPQDTHIGYSFSVEDIVSMGRNPWLGRFHPPSRHDDKIIQTAMEQVGVAQFATQPINELSGGERQRVFVARAIAQQTPIVLLDEVTANLDVCYQLEILALAKALADSGKLVIAAIHDLSMASRFCDRILLLANNTLQADGVPKQVLTEDNLRRYFRLNANVTQQPESLGLTITALNAIK